MTRTAWESVFWTPEPIYRGETVYCLASGPSMSQDVADLISGRPAIVINSTFRLAHWQPVWFFTDSGVFANNRKSIDRWRGPIITLSRAAKREAPEKVRRVQGEWRPDFPRIGAPVIRQGRSSGHTAIGLAIALGAKRVVLLGYDMRAVGGREHHHDDYADQVRSTDIYESEFIPAFKGWNADALAAGVQILNATLGSALTEFPMIHLSQVLHDDFKT